MKAKRKSKAGNQGLDDVVVFRNINFDNIEKFILKGDLVMVLTSKKQQERVIQRIRITLSCFQYNVNIGILTFAKWRLICLKVLEIYYKVI